MNAKNIIAGFAGVMVAVSAFALPVFAETIGLGTSINASATAGGVGIHAGLSAAAEARLGTIINNAETRADQEITRRVTALNALGTRVNAMVKLSADEKAGLASTIQSQITLMNNLQAQIATDASSSATSSLKADIQSITKSYRIFALIIPQGAIAAAADRVQTTVGLFGGISTKLQARITDAQSAGNDTTAAAAALADMNAKTADANTQVQAAVSETASLQPDNGDATVMASNTAALKDARSKIIAAQADLTAARKDAGTIVKDLLSFKASASASSSASVTSSGTAE